MDALCCCLLSGPFPDTLEDYVFMAFISFFGEQVSVTVHIVMPEDSLTLILVLKN